MNKILGFLLVLCCLSLVFVYGEVGANGENGHAHSTDTMADMNHYEMTHGKIELSGAAQRPSVEIKIHRDPVSGWNIEVITENFRFSPEHAGRKHVPGEGHAHLYIDGVKITRLYGRWYYLGTLSPGTHEIEVTLNANSHDDFTVHGEKISDSETVTVPSE
jgi:hypothetical protein